MARNREPVKHVESESESEDDDATSSDGSDSEPEPTQDPKKSAAKPQQSVPPPPPQPHSSSEEEESGSETDEESDGPDSSVRPLASKPMVSVTQKSSNGAKSSGSKPIAPEPVTPTKSSLAKRSADDTGTDAKDSKKLKKTAEPETSEKKSLFQRLWSEDDEIVILQGIIDYSLKYNSDPNSDMAAFHDFIKKNLQLDFTRTQLQDKIRRLKKKYANNKSKVKEGKEKTFSKPHEQKAYDLSKAIWGNTAARQKAPQRAPEKAVGSPKANGSVVRKTASKKVNADSEDVKDAKDSTVVSGEGEKLPVKIPNTNSGGGTSMEDRMLICGRDHFEVRRGLEGEQKWDELRREELKLYLKQLELRVEQTKLVLDVMKAGDH